MLAAALAEFHRRHALPGGNGHDAGAGGGLGRDQPEPELAQFRTQPDRVDPDAFHSFRRNQPHSLDQGVDEIGRVRMRHSLLCSPVSEIEVAGQPVGLRPGRVFMKNEREPGIGPQALSAGSSFN